MEEMKNDTYCVLEACAIITGIDEDIVRTGNAHLEYKVRLAASAPSEAAPWFPMALKLKQASLGQWASILLGCYAHLC